MLERREITAKELVAFRQAQLFNIKAKNSGVNDMFGDDSKRERELNIEREKIATILMNKAGIKNPDDILVKLKKREGDGA